MYNHITKHHNYETIEERSKSITHALFTKKKTFTAL
jgi:hypothetical protein